MLTDLDIYKSIPREDKVGTRVTEEQLKKLIRKMIVENVEQVQQKMNEPALSKVDTWMPDELSGLGDLRNDPDLIALTKALTSGSKQRATALAKDKNQLLIAKLFNRLFAKNRK
jgi:hypothetical protein